MYLLFVFGREVERFYWATLLHRAVSRVAGYAYRAANCLGTVAAVRPGRVTGIAFQIFIAFATVYPRAESFCRIMAKWIALILAAVYTFQLLAYHAWSDPMVVWASIGCGIPFIEWTGAGRSLHGGVP
jgi:hypothetical protein